MRTIAIYPDATVSGHRPMSFSDRWAELARARGLGVRWIDPANPDVIGQIRGCDAFMWRFHRSPDERLQARRLVPAVKYGLGIPVYPDLVTCWYYDDKIAMHYAMQAAGLPTPRTWVFWTRREASAFCRRAPYPMVLKLAIGSGSQNVRLLRTPADADAWIDVLFESGVFTLAHAPANLLEIARRARAIVPHALRRRLPPLRGQYDLQSHYLFVQEFVPGNAFDTRITVIGRRAYGFRRFNRPGDFRASGSGRFDHDPAAVAEDAIRLAFRASMALGLQAVAVDVLRREDRPVLVELGYDYVNWVVNECPGHWVLTGDPQSGRLDWVPGRMRSEDAIFDDFVAALDRGAAPGTP